MRCPICGAKMVNKQLCPYCKITDKQVLNASNKKVTKCRKDGNKDFIHFTTIIPKDVNKLKLILFTIFLGLFGVNHLYVKRVIRGWYSIIIDTLFVIFVLINMFVMPNSGCFNVIYQIIGYAMAINVILWIFDIINVFVKAFRVPVVLAEKGEKDG